MREIKFRAWDKVGKSFVRPTQITNQAIPAKGTRNGFALKTSFVLQQFVGMKDKNGREIYEGDIVQFVYHDGDTLGPGIVVFGDFSIGEDDWGVKHQTPGFVVEWWPHQEGHSGFGGDKAIEVIGNVYENPNLLRHE